MAKVLYVSRTASNGELKAGHLPGSAFLKLKLMKNRHVRSLFTEHPVKIVSGVVSAPLFSVQRLKHYPRADLLKKQARISKIFRGMVSHSKRLKLQAELITINSILES